MEKWLGLPPVYSTHGGEIDLVIFIVHVLMALLFVGWGTFFVFTLFRFAKKRNPKANYDGVKSHSSRYIEVAVAVFEAFLLIGFSIPIWASRVRDFPKEADSVVVRVVAEQFAWNIHYPGKDGVFGRTDPSMIDVQSNPLGLDRSDPAAADDFTTINQLHLPINKPVIIKLSSKDVIHSFGVPLLRVKQDAIPGMVIPVWFVANTEAQFEIVCSQLCGILHSRMRGFVTTHSQEGYDQWIAEQESTQKAANQSSGGDTFWQ